MLNLRVYMQILCHWTYSGEQNTKAAQFTQLIVSWINPEKSAHAIPMVLTKKEHTDRRPQQEAAQEKRKDIPEKKWRSKSL